MRGNGHRGSVAVLVAALLLAGCAGPGVEREGDPAIEAHFGISPMPPMLGTAQLRVEVTDSGAPAPEGTRVLARVVDPGGVEGEETELEWAGNGTFSGPALFRIAGEARLQLQVTLPDGRSATIRFPVTVSRRGG